MNIFVRNISYAGKEKTLQELFEKYGKVDSCKIIKDRDNGKSRGYGFVEMPDDGEAQHAIDKLNGVDFMGRDLAVSKAKPKGQ
jgi:RNA recognition motif-containing protein